jgi:hypothetical protein
MVNRTPERFQIKWKVAMSPGVCELLLQLLSLCLGSC